MNKSNYFVLLLVVLFIKAGFIIWLISNAGIGLGPDEAQYWTWSQALDWGYYSKPPGVAWQIWAGTKIFGNTELGVRFGAVLIGVAISIGTYFLAKAARLNDNIAFWAGIIMAFSPLGMLGSFLAITDGGMTFFWIVACILMTSALAENRNPNYLLLGVVIAAGMLFKWPMVYFWILVLGFMGFYRGQHLVELKDRKILFGILISLLGLLPSIIWNQSHEWVTFRHVFSTIKGNQVYEGVHGFFNGNFFDFFGAQAGLLSPVLFVLLIVAFSVLLNEYKTVQTPLIFCAVACFIPLAFFLVFALFKKMQGNWVAFVYPSGIVFLTWVCIEKMNWLKKWLKIGVVLSALLCGFAFTIPFIQSQKLPKDLFIPYQYNPFRQNMGWDHLEGVLKSAGYNPNTDFLFGDKYQMSSILSFYGEEQKRAYFLNLHGIRQNQFSYWPSMAKEQSGKTGYFILAENSPNLEKRAEEQIQFYQKELSQYFQEVQFLGIKPLFDNNGVMAKGALIFKCIQYNGKEPARSDLY